MAYCGWDETGRNPAFRIVAVNPLCGRLVKLMRKPFIQ